MKILIFSLISFSHLTITAGKPAPIIQQSAECKLLEIEISKSNSLSDEEDLQVWGNKLPAKVRTGVLKHMRDGKKIAAVREIKICLGTSIAHSKRIAELL